MNFITLTRIAPKLPGHLIIQVSMYLAENHLPYELEVRRFWISIVKWNFYTNIDK